MGRERSSNSKWVSGALIVILAILIFFIPSYGWKLRAWLSPGIGVSAGDNGVTGPAASQANDQSLSAMNDALEAQLARLQVVASQLPTSSSAEIRAEVYSRYPMNFRNELLVDAGTNSGVTSGTAVVFQGMLIGRVDKVFPDEALVQTIFDNGLRMPVRIGSGGANGLLQGGSYPMIGSIASNAMVADGDVAYSVAPGIPYGLPIAKVLATSTSPDSLFQQAALFDSTSPGRKWAARNSATR